jgi:hypothetical protein
MLKGDAVEGERNIVTLLDRRNRAVTEGSGRS